MANLTIPKSFPKLAGGLLEATILAMLLDAFRKGESSTITVSEIGDATGESDPKVRMALRELYSKGLVSFENFIPGAQINVLRLRNVRFEIDCSAVQAELELDEEGEFGDAGDGKASVNRNERLWDQRTYGRKIIARCQLSEIHEAGGGDGICRYRLTISVRDVGSRIEDEIRRIEDAGPYGTVDEAFAFWDEWADAYQIENAADDLEQAPTTSPISQVEDLIRNGHVKPDGGGIITVRLAPKSFRALGEALDAPDFAIADGYFEAAERNWQIHLDPEGIELEGLEESPSKSEEEAA